MNIVVLDGYALNPGDLSWSGIESLGTLRVYERSTAEQVIERAKDADLILTNKVSITEAHLQALPKVKHIAVMATGYNIIDLEAAKKRGITVSNIPNYSTASVVQLTFALLLGLCNRVELHSDAVLNGKWSSAPDFSFQLTPQKELANKTLGIVGFGSIGQSVADVATALGMNILAYSRTQTDQSHRKNFQWVNINEIFKNSDVLSLHCPLTKETAGIVNKQHLSLMKNTAFLINTARGPLIQEQDLADALNNNQLAGAGLDVLSVEPPSPDNPLLSAKNCLITPHIAWASFEARSRLMGILKENLEAFQTGKAKNIVSG